MYTVTVEKGIEATSLAVSTRDVVELARCIRKMKTIQAPIEALQKALLQCPASLLFEAGYDLVIASKKTGTNLKLSSIVNGGSTNGMV